MHLLKYNLTLPEFWRDRNVEKSIIYKVYIYMCNVNVSPNGVRLSRKNCS